MGFHNRYTKTAAISLLGILLAFPASAQLVTFHGSDLKSNAPTMLNNNFTWLNTNKADTSHTHTGVYAPLSHVHLISDITGLQAALVGRSAYCSPSPITGTTVTIPASDHGFTHGALMIAAYAGAGCTGDVIGSNGGTPPSAISVDGSTYAVTVTFASSTTFYVAINGGVGPAGAAASIAVGTVSTGAPGSSVVVTNVGTSSAAIFNITIPRGDTGASGNGSISSTALPICGDGAGAGVACTAAMLSSVFYATGGGTAQAQTATPTGPSPSLVAGLKVCWLPAAANTGAGPTLAYNGLTAKTITKFGTAALIASDITTTAVACAIYDSVRWQLQNPQTATASAALPWAIAYNAAAYSSQASGFVLTFDTNVAGSNATMHNTGSNTSRFVAPNTGVYSASCQFSFSAGGAASQWGGYLMVNGTTTVGIVANLFSYTIANFSRYQVAAPLISLAANDYVECVTITTGTNTTLKNGAQETVMSMIQLQ